MDNSSQSDVAKQLAKLQLRFKQELPSKIAQIEKSCADLCLAEINETALSELHHKVHSLSGSGGTFGAVAVSTVAHELELILKSLLNEQSETTPFTSLAKKIKQQLNASVSILKETCESWQPSDIPYIQPVDSKQPRIGNLIYLVDDDELLAADLITKLEHSKFNVKYFNNVNDFEVACKVEMPAAIIMDMVFSESDVAGADIINKLKGHSEFCPPVIFISVRNDIEVRLAAARAGASRYFCKPLDVNKLSKTLDGLTARTLIKPYRILIIDDDESLLQYYATVLRDAGMEVKTLSDPLQGLEAMTEFKPDIIVTDVYMSGCSGLELAQVIRQDDTWALTPIMFLSTETDINRQLAAMNLGGDDFLVKPVDADHLIAAVIARAKRARWTNRLNRDLDNALRESEFQLTTMNQHDLVSETDISGKITHVNDKFCKVSGYSREELLGQNHCMLKSGFHSDSFYKGLWSTISQGEVWHGTICNRKKDGSEYWVKSTIVPFLDDKGKPYKYVSARTDISELKINEARLAFAIEGAGDGIWDWDMPTNAMQFSQLYMAMLGYAENELPHTVDTWTNSVHPDDLANAQKKLQDYLENRVPVYNVELRLRCKDDSYIWVLCRGTIVNRDNEGKPLRMIGIHSNINERKMAEFRQQGYNHILHLIAQGKLIKEVLEAVIWHAETMLSGALCSVLLLDPSGKFLEKGIAPNLPDFYNKAIDGLEIGLGVGPCGEAAFSGKRVVAREIMSHPNWINFKELAQKAGLQACWSEPFFSSAGHVLGTFTIYFPTPKQPVESDLNLLVELAQFAAIAVERTLSQKALVDAKDEAENANRAKSQFLSSMSHELRTPMNAIMGFGQLLTMETEPALTESQQENVKEIVKAGNHLLQLINEVLDLAKIESGRIDLSLEAIALGEVIVESVQLITTLAQKRGIEIAVSVNGIDVSLEQLLSQDLAVRADRTRLRQVLLNLLSNAVKYNNEKGKIIIACQHINDSQTRISITDTGEGISKEQQGQLFKAFNRLGAEQTDIEGSGIGLVITKNIVELMGGDIGIESQVGKGSTFWFELPSDTLLPAQKNISGEKEVTATSTPFSDSESKYTVLYIEDNPANLRLVAQLLGRMKNIHMWSAHEPMLGLELAAEHKPDLILLDINLPGMDGFGVLKHLRQREATRNTPVIAISANAMPKDIEKGMKAGFDDYITKPIDVRALLQAVKDRLES